MKHQYLNYSNKNDLIEGVILRKLTIHKDASGTLVETLRTDWADVCDPGASFAMQYLSITPKGLARDEDKWHVHKFQKDRFICISGRIVTAIYDVRENSSTHGKLNLFIQSPKNDDEMYLIVIPQLVYHSFMVISKTPGYLLNFPTKLYRGDDEGRVPNTQLIWQDVRDDFGI